MLRSYAMRRYGKKFIHELRNGYSVEKSLDRAFLEVKEEMLHLLYQSKEIRDITDANRREIEVYDQWSKILDSLMEYRLALEILPVDTSNPATIPSLPEAVLPDEITEKGDL